MKLNPPASSSDLATAREIARRLHQSGRGSEHPAPPPAASPHGLIPPAGVQAPAPAPPAFRPSPTQVRPVPPPASPRLEPAAAPRPAAAPPAPQPPPFQPRVFEPPPVPVAKPAPPPVPPAPALSRPPLAEPPAPPEPPVLPSIDALGGLEEPSAPPGDADDESIVIEEPGASIEDIVSEAELSSVEDIVDPSESVPDEPAPEPVYEAPEVEEPVAMQASASPFDDVPQPDAVSEELFDMPPPPSWGDIAETCMTLGHARGAMFIDPTGQVFATRGQWPDPGSNAIATKLVAMMEKTLKDAPTRSVSAPLGGLHLTAWRVPLAEGLITAAFIADAPLRAELRTPIDAQILAGEGL